MANLDSIKERMVKAKAAAANGSGAAGEQTVDVEAKPDPKPANPRPANSPGRQAGRANAQQAQRPQGNTSKGGDGGQKTPGKRIKVSTGFVLFVVGTIVIVFVAAMGVSVPGVLNYLLQPWEWAVRNMLGGVLNTLAIIPMVGGIVAFSTRLLSITAYCAVQIVQSTTIVMELCGVKVPADARLMFQGLRSASYGLEFPVNFCYAWQNYSDGSGRIDSWFLRFITVFFVTAIQTMIVETLIMYVGGFVNAVIKTINNHLKGGANVSVD
jgi:hypothetical protein